MRYYSKNITPDSLSGMVFALEGIRKSAVAINGPTGCKFYHGAVSDSQFPGQASFDPLNYPEVFYFGQPRVPCTYLDSYDYVYGSKEKLNELLAFINDGDYELVAIINSPGAALIGDDLEGIASKKVYNAPVITIESPEYSEGFYKGFQEALISLIKKLDIKKEKKRENSVNLIGISIYNRYFKGDLQEIEELLELCGIQLNCVLCADTQIDEIKKLSQASLNVVLYPELGLEIAKYLESSLDMPYFLFDKGLPIGFDLTREYMEDILSKLYEESSGGEQSERVALQISKRMSTLDGKLERVRVEAYLHISRIHSLTGLPKGATFSIEGSTSSIFAYTQFLFKYLGMIPESITPLEDDPGLFTDKLVDLLDTHGLSSSYKRDIYEGERDILLANGNTIAQLTLDGQNFTGIEIEMPSMGHIDVIPKTHLGIRGSLLLIEKVLNGMKF